MSMKLILLASMCFIILQAHERMYYSLKPFVITIGIDDEHEQKCLECKEFIETWTKEQCLLSFAIRLLEDELDSLSAKGKKTEPIFIELHQRLHALTKKRDESIVEADKAAKTLELKAIAAAQKIAHQIAPTCKAIEIKSYSHNKIDKKFDITELIINELDNEYVSQKQNKK